jgi:hypothetical protein
VAVATARRDPQRGWLADWQEEATPLGFDSPLLEEVPRRRLGTDKVQAEHGRVLSPGHDKDRAVRLLSEYQDAADQADRAADALFTASLKLERNIQGQKERPLPGTPLFRHPQIVRFREVWLHAAVLEEQRYVAWLHAINEYGGLEWGNRIEVAEIDGWYHGIIRQGQSHEFLVHRDNSPGQYNSRHEAVIWLHRVIMENTQRFS